MKNAQFYLLAMQSSAARPHASATELVQPRSNSSLPSPRPARFGGFCGGICM